MTGAHVLAEIHSIEAVVDVVAGVGVDNVEEDADAHAVCLVHHVPSAGDAAKQDQMVLFSVLRLWSRRLESSRTACAQEDAFKGDAHFTSSGVPLRLLTAKKLVTW